ncbi:MAG: LPS export ABC transporter periplasmic protein LptC [Chitinophagales bacterium]|nr:LPS export ABC transporter periplasmic protein LptC [Chitinophagales bacterium]
MRFILFIFLASLIYSCSTKVEEIDAFFDDQLNAGREEGTNVRIIYSDSAKIRLIVNAPLLERYNEEGNTMDVFPKGILIEFMNNHSQTDSWLKAESAIRESRTKRITAKGNVVFYNAKNEKLETPELIFDEKDRIVFTDKLVRISQAEKGDTTYGFGFRANPSFTIFEIRKKVQGKLNVGDFIAEFK